MSEEKKNPPRAQIFRHFRIESRNKNLTFDARITLRVQLILSRNEYCNLLCFGVRKDLLLKLELLQNGTRWINANQLNLPLLRKSLIRMRAQDWCAA